MIAPSTRPRHRHLLALVLVALVTGTWPASTGTVHAADAPANLLDRVIVDLAVLGPGSTTGTARGERIITLEPSPDGARGNHRIALLERGDGRWTERASLDVPGTGDPWLIDLGEGLFAVITSPGGAMSAVATLAVHQDGLELLDRSSVPFAVQAAAGADVDGDGTRELVLAGRALRRQLGVCLGTRLLIVDPRTLSDARELELRGLEFDGAVLGEFDGTPGADLAGFTHCRPRTIALPSRLIAVRLEDGRITFEAPVPDAALNVPLAVDLNGDGTDELVLEGSGGLTYADPADAASGPWSIASEPALGFIGARAYSVGRRTVDGATALVAMNAREVSVVGPFAQSDVRDGIGPERPPSVSSGPTVSPRWSRVTMLTGEVQQRREPVAGLWADLGSDGCEDYLMPSHIVLCGPDTGGEGGLAHSFQNGPELIGSRPLAVVGTGSFRRVLIAQTATWTADLGIRVPTPLPAWLAGGHGGWRQGPSGPFVLAELSLPDLLYFPSYPVPSLTMESRTTGSPSVVQASGWTGTIYLAMIAALGDDERGPAALPDLDDVVSGAAIGSSSDPPDGAGRVAIDVRIAVAPGHAAGSDTAAATIPLAEIRATDGSPARRWAVTLVAINAWGEISSPISGVVTRDLSGPTMTVSAPFLSVPWPLTTRIAGISEPGAIVRVNGGDPLTTTSRGLFETRLTLAPWPQDVLFTSVDPAGNETVRSISMVGGLDYRQLPWQVIVALLVIALVMVGTIVEGRRARVRTVGGVVAAIRDAGPSRRPGWGRPRNEPWLRDERDDVPLPEIEEIPPTHG